VVSDYRNRPPVDAPRLTVRSVLTSQPATMLFVAVAGWIGALALVVALAVLLGWRW